MGNDSDLDKEEEESGGLGSRPFFSAFRKSPAPRKAAPLPVQKPPPAEKPAPVAKPPAAAAPAAPAAPAAQAAESQAKPKQAVAPVEERLAALEKKISAAPVQPSEAEMLLYMKNKISDLEKKLNEAQEKAVAFACELKGREEIRRESQREMEELLSVMRRNQAEAEAERSRSAERERSRERIDALEKRLLELSASGPKQEEKVSDRMDKLASAVVSLEQKMDQSDLAAQLGSIAAAVAGLQEKVSGAPVLPQLDSLAAAVAGLQEKVSGAPVLPQLDSLAAAVADLRDRDSALAGRLDSLGAALTELRNLPPPPAVLDLSPAVEKLAERVRELEDEKILSVPPPSVSSAEYIRDLHGFSTAAEAVKYSSYLDSGSKARALENLEAAIIAALESVRVAKASVSAAPTAEEPGVRPRGCMAQLDTALEGLRAAMRFYKDILRDTRRDQGR